MKKTFFLLFLMFPYLLFSNGQPDKYFGDEGKITAYISGPENMLKALEAAFEKERGDVIDFVQMGCGPLRQRIWAEWESGQIRADVFWGSDPLIYNKLDDAGALEDYRSLALDMVKEEYRTERNYTFISERYGVIIYNEDLLAGNPFPASYDSLLEEQYRNLIIQADPAQSSTALAITSCLWSLKGESWDFYEGLIRDQSLMLAKKNSDVPSRIQEGEFLAGIAPHDAVLRLQKKAKKEGYPMPLKISWPREGAMAIVRPIAISKNEDRPESNEQLAHDFVDFLLSQQAQKITSNFGFVSVRKDLPAPEWLPGDTVINRMDWEYLGENQEDIRQNFNALFE